jgi:hypothetical protein
MTGQPGARPDSPFDPKIIIASIAATAFGVYTGIHFVIPTIFAVALMFITRKLFPENRRRYIVLFSLQAAHALWLCVALFSPSAQAVVIDVVLVSGLLTWLLMRPGKAPLYALAVYQLISLYINTAGLFAVELNTPAHKALLVHVLYRVLALTYIAIALFGLHRDEKRNTAVG